MKILTINLLRRKDEDYYRWEIKKEKDYIITTQGFNSITAGLKILKKDVTLNSGSDKG